MVMAFYYNKLNKHRWNLFTVLNDSSFSYIMYCHIRESYIYEIIDKNSICDEHYFTLKAWGRRGYR